MPRRYDFAVFIGRFSPFHNGHKAVIDHALTVADNVILVLGSSFAPRNYRNPFTYLERVNMIRDAYPQDAGRLIFEAIEDTIYNDTHWVEQIQHAVTFHTASMTEPKITLIGHEKDHTSFYLKLFPQWDNIGVSNVDGINSTAIREEYFRYCSIPLTVTASTGKFLIEFMESGDYRNIREEYQFVDEYKKLWAAAPYAPIFVTVDAVVVQSGHILLVERKARPGKGLWAIPGGFLNPEEKIIDATIRELKEETKIKVPVPVLRGNIVTTKVFDDPHRSSRGRTITHASLIHLPPDTALPKVKGSDDAKFAKWWPMADIRREMLFEDHKDIIDHLTAML